jgi:hypothetical protein
MKDCLGLKRQREWIKYRMEERLLGHLIHLHLMLPVFAQAKVWVPILVAERST